MPYGFEKLFDLEPVKPTERENKFGKRLNLFPYHVGLSVVPRSELELATKGDISRFYPFLFLCSFLKFTTREAKQRN